MARIALERIQDDLESAIIFDEDENLPYKVDLDSWNQFAGEDSESQGRCMDSIRFISRSHLILDQWSRKYGIARIAYSIRENEVGEGFILYRSDTPEIDKSFSEEDKGLVLCEDVFSFNLTYYDSDGNPYDSWDSNGEAIKGKLPAMVLISLDIFNRFSPESPIKFISGVVLPMAGIRYGRTS
ncbi:MAG TPA: type II secretion system protein GspJ [Desulfobacteraceae bacterium]|nr:type II secretion system protein GspJ [Desulfobacteraceae bacterium]HPJ66893.1 type II secretion system protein GspJ [Desulfobacteraceae bacterium]HPQ27648.1 type II secretion system protein GspJ [Desulfobacteraceae bacterium]